MNTQISTDDFIQLFFNIPGYSLHYCAFLNFFLQFLYKKLWHYINSFTLFGYFATL